jgi:NNP family nitrate/nitrite transporter-like MFS transporter
MNNVETVEVPEKEGHRSKFTHQQVVSIFFLVVIFFLNVLSRIILSPLMPTVERDLKIGHDEAGSLFLCISLGYSLTLLGSGLISSRFNHKRTIIISSVAVTGTLFAVAASHNLWWIRGGLLFLGMAGGLYFPSGIAFLTGLISSKHWGKAFAIHELAPNLACAAAPFLTEALLSHFSWRRILVMLGVACLFSGAVFIHFGRGGETRGEAPSVKTFRAVFAEPSFWIMVLLFSLGIGAGMGIYTMIPLYLVSERGMDRAQANILLGFSRLFTFVMAILAGVVTDRMGAKKTIKGVLLASGGITLLLGMAPGSWIGVIVFIQPLFSVCFFPPGLAALSRVGGSRIRSGVFSLTIPMSILIGSGAIPAGIGFLGEAGSFALGIMMVGALLLCGLIALKYLRFERK